MKKIGMIVLSIFLITINVITPIAAETTSEVAETTDVQVEDTTENTEIVEEGQSTENNIEATQEQISITPYETVVNGGVTLNVPDYNATNKWNVETVYNVQVNVNFADAVSTDKQIKITLPEGMRYVSIPVHESQGNAGKDVEVQADSILTGSISSIVMPTASALYKTIDGKNDYHGELTYNVIPGMTGVEIKGLQVTVDGAVYYEPKTITDAIQVEATQNSGAIVGNTSLDVLTKGNVAYSFFSSGRWKEFSIMEGETETFSLNNISVYRSGDLYPKQVFNKKYEVTYYYPKEFTYVDFNASGYTLTEHNATEGYIKLVRENFYYTGTNTIGIRVSNPGLPIGTYTAKGPKFEITTYDDRVITNDYTTSSAINTKVNILSASDPLFNNQLDIKGKDMGYTDISDDYFVQGPLFTFTTPTSKGKDAQVLEYLIDPSFEVASVIFPTGTLNGITSIEYKTNLNSTIQIATGSEIELHNNYYASNSIYSYKITKQKLGLQENEYITYAKASVGDLPKGFNRSSGDMNYTSRPVIGMIGRLQSGVASANVTVNSWSEATPGVVESGSENSLTKSVNRNLDKTSVFNTGITDYSVPAGSTQKITGTLATHSYYYSYTLGMVNPTIYIRQPEGISINPSTIVLKQGTTILNPTNVTEEILTLTGEKVLKIETDVKIGSFFGNNLSSGNTLTYSFDLKADITATGNYTWNDLIFFETANGMSAANRQLAQQPDIYDVNNNGNTTEKLGTPNKNKLNIIEQKVLVLDTYITPEGESRKAAYDTSDASTAIGFTPGTKADYTIDLFNNRDDAVDKFISYIPIPKTGENFGEQFQSEAFKWDMKLDSGSTATIEVYDRDGNLMPSEAANYVLSYSDDEVASNFTTTGFYASGVSDGTYTSSITNNTSMIKLEKTTPIQSGERVVVTFKYEVNETSSSAAGKLSTINDFRPYYYFKAGSEGFQSGTRVGARLEIGEISGLLFEDVNVNGIYDTGDTVQAGQPVKLYQKNSSGTYVEHASSPVLTAADGTYKFEGLGNGVYKVDFNDAVVAGSKEFTLRKQGTNDGLDSDVQYSGVNRGIVENIDATADSAKLVTAGYINYNASTDLNITSLPTSVSMQASNAQKTNTTNINGTITPSFFNTIKASNNAIAWTSSDASIVSTTSGTASGVLTAGQSTGSTETETITVTLTDMYGYTKVVTIPVTITSNDIPVVSGSNMTIEAGTTFDKLTTGVTINDTEDGAIALTDAKVTITDNVPVNGSNQAVTPGTYTVIYAVEDADGNTASKTINVTVQDTTAPAITTTNTTVTAEANNNSTLPVWETVFGVAVNDIVDGNITADTSKVTYSVSPSFTANNVPGTYTITVSATDTATNSATQTLTYIVQDTTAPSITTTDTTKTVEANSSSTLPVWETVFGVAVNDIVDGDITADTSKVTYSVSPAYTANNIPGTYTITVSSTDAASNTATQTVTYVVQDTTAPVITTTDTTKTVEANDNSTLPVWETVFGVAVNDIVDGDITANTSKVTYSVSPVYTANNIPGTYTITISGTDAASNNATQTVTYIVADTTAPVITTTNTSVTVEANDTATLPDWGTVFGVAVNDIVDGDITANTSKVTYSVSPSYTANNVPGTYTITVSATDAATNNSTTTLTYIVQDTTIPTLNIANTTVYVAKGDTQTEAELITLVGATATDVTGTPTVNINMTPIDFNTVGTYVATVSAKDATNNTATGTITVEVIELITAENFTVALADVPTTDFVTAANASGWELNTSVTTPTASTITLVSEKPITVGTHNITFKNAENITITVQVLVTNTAPVNNETVVANNFTVKLSDVATADFITLANAKGYDITDPTTPVEIPVTEITTRPTTVGTHTVRFETTNGGYAEVQVLVTNESPINNETVVANNFTIKLSDVATADFITLADAKGYDITNPAAPVEIPVTEITTRPTTVGTHIVRFETANGGYAEIQVLVTNEDPINNETVVANNFTIKLSDVATADFITLANAKGYDITNPATPVEIPVTEITARPTTVGTHTVRFETANGGYAEIQVLVTNEAPINNETVVANNFTIKLVDVATADFITLADAKGYDITNPTTPIEIPLLEITARPTTVGTHTVRFETANGGYAEIQVLVTNEAPINNETVIANNFAIKLADVATADFITLANAKGYDITNPATPVEIPVTEITARPTTVGTHTVRFETANGGYAEVQVLVTNESPVNNETVVANNFTIKLSDVATADFVTLANAKGYDITNSANPIEIPVTLASVKPVTAGTHIARFETVNGGYAEVNVVVTISPADYNFEATDFEINLSDLTSVIESGQLETEIINRSNAKVINTATGQEEFGIRVADIDQYTVFNNEVYSMLLTYDITQSNTNVFTTNADENINQINKSIQMTVLKDDENSDNNSDGETKDILPKTGKQYTSTIFGIFVLLMSGIILSFVRLRKQKEN